MNMEQKNSHDSFVDLVCQYQFENGSYQFLFLDVDQNEKKVELSLTIL